MYSPDSMAHSHHSPMSSTYTADEDQRTEEVGHITEERELPSYRNNDMWDNQLEQERHIQRQIRQQSVLNPIQMLSSLQQERATNTTNDRDYSHLHKHHSTTIPKRTSEEKNKQPSTATTSTPFDKNVSYHTKQPSSSTPSTKPSTASVLSNLKLLFPNHKEDQLVSILDKCNYNLDLAISAILGEDNLANSFTT